MRTQDSTNQTVTPRVCRLDYEPTAASAPCSTCGTPLAVAPVTVHAPAADVPAPTQREPHDPAVRGHVQMVVTLALEALDGRRSFSQLDTLMEPSAVRFLLAVARGHRIEQVSRLRSLRICQPADGIAEAAARITFRGRPRALAARSSAPSLASGPAPPCESCCDPNPRQQ